MEGIVNLPGEQWKHIEGTDKKYLISNKGRIISLWKTPIIMKYATCKNGYLKVVLTTEQGVKTMMPHRLVGLHWVENPNNKEEINHLNGIKTSIDASNLEWVTRTENVRHAVLKGLHRGFVKGHIVKRINGSAVHTSVITEEIVRAIRLDRAAGLKHRELSEKYSLKMSTINSALYCWKHLK